ncbi:MAG TPA: TonB family protein, partial [Chthoniobacteraceae bacterium]|nr:TonB family protein [Chthoniobacteraceae bacterium]
DQPPAVETPPAPEPTPAPAVEQPEPTPVPEMEQPAPEPTPEPAMTEPNPDATPAATAAPSPRTRPVSQHPRTTSAAPHHEANSLPATGATGGVRTSVRYLNNPRPEYPDEARRLRQEGVVLLNVEVGTDGRPNDVTVKHSSGYPLLDNAAVAAVKRWMFEPASVASIPVASKVDVPVRFTLSQ